MTSLNEWTQVYMNGMLPQQWNNNLQGITVALNDGKRTPQQIYSVLMGMGVPTDRALFAINSYITPKYEQQLGYIDANKNNQHMMENFDHKILAKKIESLIENLKVMTEENSTKLNYSAQLSSEIAKRYLNEINGVIINLEEIKKNDELSEKVKLRTNRSDLTGRSEFIYAGKLIKELYTHNWINPVSNFINEVQDIINANKYTALVSKAIKTLVSEKNKLFYESTIADLEYLATKDEKGIKENFRAVLDKHEWIPVIKQMISTYAIDEKELVSNSEGIVNKVYSPVRVNEDSSIVFALDGNYLKLIEGKIVKATPQEIDGRFLNTEKALKNFKIVDENYIMYHGKNTLTINTKENTFKVNTQIVEQKNLKNYLIRSTFFGMNEMYKLDEVLFLVESLDNIKELDFVTSITSLNDARVKVNIMKIGESIYVNRINPFMNVNEIKLAESAEAAQTMVNEYVKFDITNSVVDLLEKETQNRMILVKEKQEILEKIKFLESKKREINNTLDLVGANQELQKALEVMESELRDRELELQLVYSKLGHSISEKINLEELGFVTGKMKITEGMFKKDQPIWVYAEDYTTKGSREEVLIKDEFGKKEGRVEKKNIIVNL